MALIVGIAGVSAATYFPSGDVTYDNKESGLSSTDVQGAIDELYTTCSSSMKSGNYLFYTSNQTWSGNQVTYASIHQLSLNSQNDKIIYSINNINIQEIDSVYVTDNYIYYSTGGNDENGVLFPAIYRIDLTGNNVKQLYNVGGVYNNYLKNIKLLYVNNNYIYFYISGYFQNNVVEYPAIWRINLDGSQATKMSDIKTIDVDNITSVFLK